MTPGAEVIVQGRGHITHIVKMHYFLKKSSLLLWGTIQAILVHSNDDKWNSQRNCKFHDPRDRGSSAKVWPYKSYSRRGSKHFQRGSWGGKFWKKNVCWSTYRRFYTKKPEKHATLSIFFHFKKILFYFFFFCFVLLLFFIFEIWKGWLQPP